MRTLLSVKRRGPEVGFEEIASDLLQARFWPMSERLAHLVGPKSDERIDLRRTPNRDGSRWPTWRLPDFGNSQIYLTLGAFTNSRSATGRNQCKQSGGVSA